jgi:hypothetical protein
MRRVALSLKCDILVSKFAFKCVNLYRYTEGRELLKIRTKIQRTLPPSQGLFISHKDWCYFVHGPS